MAGSAADFGLFHCGRITPSGDAGKRATSRKNEIWIGRLREFEVSIQAGLVLSAHRGKHVFDRGSQWDAAEHETLLESRPALHTAGCSGRPIAGAGFQYCRPVAHGMAGGSLLEEVRHAANVLAGCG